MAKIAYIRVSTIEQNEARQRESLSKYSIDKWFLDKVSAKDTNRPQLQAMLDYAREGDTVYIHDFSRLARSTADLLQLVQQLQDKGIHLVSVKESIDTNTPTGRLMLTIAKEQGKYKGRKQIIIEDFAEKYELYKNRQIRSKAELAKQLGISRPTLDKMITEADKNQ